MWMGLIHLSKEVKDFMFGSQNKTQLYTPYEKG